MRASGKGAVAVIVGAGAVGSVVGSILACFLLNRPNPNGVPPGQGLGNIASTLTIFSLPGKLIGSLVLALVYSALPNQLSTERRALSLLFLGPTIGTVVSALPFLIGGHLAGATAFAGVGAFYALCTTVAWLLLDYRLSAANDS